MKKFAALFMSVFFGLSVFGQSTLNNGNFEGWYFAPHPTHAGQGFYEPTGGFFQTLNILDTIATPPGLTAYPTDSMHTGRQGSESDHQEDQCVGCCDSGGDRDDCHQLDLLKRHPWKTLYLEHETYTFPGLLHVISVKWRLFRCHHIAFQMECRHP